MGIKERGIVLGFAAVVCLVGSTIHTAPFGVGPAGRVREDRPDSAISSVQAGGERQVLCGAILTRRRRRTEQLSALTACDGKGESK